MAISSSTKIGRSPFPRPTRRSPRLKAGPSRMPAGGWPGLPRLAARSDPDPRCSTALRQPAAVSFRPVGRASSATSHGLTGPKSRPLPPPRAGAFGPALGVAGREKGTRSSATAGAAGRVIPDWRPAGAPVERQVPPATQAIGISVLPSFTTAAGAAADEAVPEARTESPGTGGTRLGVVSRQAWQVA